VGHAFVQERLGFDSQEDMLGRFGGRMGGIHIHDVVGYDDHWAPGTGEVDFELVARYVPSDAVRVIEVHSKVSSAELTESMRFVERVGLA